MECPTVINWTSRLLILGLLCGIFHFISEYFEQSKFELSTFTCNCIVNISSHRKTNIFINKTGINKKELVLIHRHVKFK